MKPSTRKYAKAPGKMEFYLISVVSKRQVNTTRILNSVVIKSVNMSLTLAIDCEVENVVQLHFKK